MEQIVRVSKKYNYVLDQNGTIDWHPKWTFENALLFTMSTLTVIGKKYNKIFKQINPIILKVKQFGFFQDMAILHRLMRMDSYYVFYTLLLDYQ